MSVMMTVEVVEAALGPMKTMLIADGYLLDARLQHGVVEISVSATADACAECLVPKEMLAAMAADMITRQGVDVDASTLSITYPADQ